MRDVGNNYGNLCFYQGTVNILKDHDIYFFNQVNQINNPDYIVVTLANSICNVKSCINFLGHLIDIMSKFKCKKILLSIGAQNDNLQMFDLHEDNKTVVKKFFSNFDFINLRGKYTRDLLNYNKINYDYKILGCPSIYLAKPIMINTININNDTNILFNAPRNNQPNCSFILELIKDKSIDFLYQDSYSQSKQNIIVPDNYFHWKDIISKYDFIIGTRIHGSIIALSSGIPTLLLVIDSRTYELAEIFKIPYINLIDREINLKNKSDIIELVNNHKFNYDNYNNCIDEYKKNIKSLLSIHFDL